MEVVDTSSCRYTALALDPVGSAHVSYLQRGEPSILRYATNGSGKWASTPLDVKDGYRDWIAVDPQGHAHVVCTSKGLQYLTNRGGTWSSAGVDSQASHGTSVAVDLSGKVHILYIRKPDPRKLGELVHAVRSGDRWERTSVDTICRERGDEVGLALDAQGHAHVAYYDDLNRALKYATNSLGKWETRVVASVGEFLASRPAIGVDSKKRVHILFGDQEGFVLRHAIYGAEEKRRALSATAGREGTKVQVVEVPGGRLDRWVVRELQPIGTDDCSAALDREDTLHVAWISGSALMYGRLKDGTWETQTLDPRGGGGGGHHSLVVDGSGKVHVVYLAFDGEGLKYARSRRK